MKKVLLTGATGFIGSHVARILVREGSDVFAIARPSSDRWRLDDVARDIQFVEGDLNDLGGLKPRLQAIKPDVCIHLAWRGWSGIAQAEENLSSLGVSLDLMRLMPELGCPRFVAVGTCFEYDLDKELLSEDTALNPRELYGTCKKSLFEVGRHFSALTGVEIVTPRVFYSYGPYEDVRRLVPSIALALLKGEVAKATRGEQVRDYVHVQDVAAAIRAVAASDLEGAVNIASGVPVTIGEVANKIAAILGREDLVQLGALPYRPGEPMKILGDPSMIREHTGWEPRIGLEEGLAETISWWRDRV